MFTGIVEELGTDEHVATGEGGIVLRIRAELAAGLRDGDSVAVSGTCLTITRREPVAFEAEVMHQTARLTTLGSQRAGDRVNLETPLRAGEPLGGHIVQGHVDCVGEVEAVESDGFARRLQIAVPEEQHRYLVERGSVTVDGVSLTIAALVPQGFVVSLVPETLARTTLGSASRGETEVNVEVDVLARHVERLLGFTRKGSG